MLPAGLASWRAGAAHRRAGWAAACCLLRLRLAPRRKGRFDCPAQGSQQAERCSSTSALPVFAAGAAGRQAGGRVGGGASWRQEAAAALLQCPAVEQGCLSQGFGVQEHTPQQRRAVPGCQAPGAVAGKAVLNERTLGCRLAACRRT